MIDFRILDHEALGALSSPFRRQLLEELGERPDSATNIAKRHNLSRQRVGYHMRELERSGYLEVAEERQQRGLKERLYRARSFAYVHAGQADRGGSLGDRYSWATLLNLMAKGLWDLISLRRGADKANKRLATLGIEAELTFASPAARRRFSQELVSTIETLVERHSNAEAPNGRSFKLIVGAYPATSHGRSTHDKTED